MKKDDTKIEGSEIPVEETVGTNMISDVSVEADVAPVGDASSDAPIAEPSPEANPTEDATSEAQPTAAEPAPTETTAAPGYGAPQMLYEDFIPYEYLHDTPPPAVADTPAETLAREEEEKIKKEKEKEKKKKPSREEAALLAAVEAEIAAQSAAQPAVQAAPVAQDTPAPEPEAPIAQPEAPAAPEPAAPVAAENPVTVVAPVSVEHEEADQMDEEVRMNEPVEREYTSQEKKWRRKYKMDKDILLSANGVVPGFVLAKGENVVRCYACLDAPKGDGTICLTNKRILINADERSEVEVENVSGVKFSKNTYFSFFKFLFALIFFGVGAFLIAYPFLKESMQVAFIENIWRDWFKYLFVAVGAILVLISFPLWAKMVKKYFYFNIFIKESTPFFECKSKSVVKCEKKGGQFTFLLTDAGREIEKAARELGALILEVKAGRYNF